MQAYREQSQRAGNHGCAADETQGVWNKTDFPAFCLFVRETAGFSEQSIGIAGGIRLYSVIPLTFFDYIIK